MDWEYSKEDFIDQFKNVVASGGGFVPFIGSGCSAASGIIMGQDFNNYLAYVVYRCVARPRSESSGRKGGELDQKHSSRWDLRRDGWPERPHPEEIAGAKKWIRTCFDDVCKATGFWAHPKKEESIEIITLKPLEKEINPQDRLSADHDSTAQRLLCPLVPAVLHAAGFNQKAQRRLLPLFGGDSLGTGGALARGYSPSSEDAIIERAVRSLYDWRATLSFLSELKLVDDVLLLEAPDSAVIDSFNVHITSGKKPNLTHNMLCHLAGSARFRVILTTNFDSLIEDAFAEMGDHLEPISVSVKGDLPDPALVHARNTVVKMHGTRWETRADFSLDDSPSRESKRRFFHYVMGRYPDRAASIDHPTFLPSHLLVCGYSGSDNLCMEMMKYILDAGGPDARIFWICNSQSSLERLNTVFPEQRAYAGRLIATWTDRLDLLLYEIYQHLCLSLPKGGFSYQYTPNVPPEVHLERSTPVSTTSSHSKGSTSASETAAEKLVRWFAHSAKGTTTSANLRVISGEPGVLSTLRNVANTVVSTRKGTPIWLELEDYADIWSLAYDLLLIISTRLGLFQLGHAEFVSAVFRDACEALIHGNLKKEEVAEKVAHLWLQHIKFLCDRYFKIVPGEWLIVLYGRNGAGGCTGWGRGNSGDEKDNLLEASYWGDREFGTRYRCGEFPPFLSALCATGFRVIYSPYCSERENRDRRKWGSLKRYIRDELGVPLSSLKLRKELKDQYRFIPCHPQARLAELASPEITIKGDEVDQTNDSTITFKNSMSKLLRRWIRGIKSEEKANEHRLYDYYFTRLRFLYATTLFRQSRHYSAFLSEAVMQASERFNRNGIDNDWCRDEAAGEWRNELLQIGLFYEKPGGFAWSYRDFRLGVRQILDLLPEEYLERIDSEPFADWRSHIHYYIADWYLRAFYTTRHAMPLMEGIYHLYQCIIHLDNFREKRFKKDHSAGTWRRYRRWRIAVCEMTKALRLGFSSIRLWFGNPQFRSWFDEHSIHDLIKDGKVVRRGVITMIRESRPKGLEIYPGRSKAAKKKAAILDEHSERLMQVLAAELDTLVARGQTPSSQSPKSYATFGLDSETKQGRPAVEYQTDEEEPWKAIPRKNPIRKLAEAVNSTGKSSPELWTQVKDWSKKQLQENSSDERIFYSVQELVEWAFLFLRHAKLRQLSKSHPNAVQPTTIMLSLDDTSKTAYQTVAVFCGMAIEWCRLLHPTLDTFEQKERVRALCLYSVALARLGRFLEAHRRLNEANALLSKIDTGEKRVLLGMIKLRRAEVHLLEAVLIPDLGKLSGVEPFDVKHLKKRYKALLIAGTLPSEEREFDSGACSRFHIAKIDDAWSSLEQAERLLAGQLHSPRWWARLCSLKLRCLLEFPGAPRDDQGAPRDNQDGTCHYRPLCRRVRKRPIDQISDLFAAGIASSQTHETLRLRLADFALRGAMCWSSDRNKDESEARKDIAELAHTVLAVRLHNLNPRAGSAKTYAESIARYLNQHFSKELPEKAKP